MKTRSPSKEKIVLCIVTLLLATALVSAQQIPLLLQNRDNQAILNPAALSNDYLIYNRSIGAEIVIRNYFLNSDLAPKTGAVSVHKILREQGVKLLIGANIILDDEEFTETTTAQIRLAGIFSTNPDREKIVVGLSGGMSQFRINTENVRLVDAGDVKGMTSLTQWYPDISLGVFYARWLQNDDNFYAGFSVPQLFSLNKTVSTETGNYLLEKQAHYIGQLGYHKFVGEDSFLEPSARILFVPDAPIYFDAKLRWKWGKFIWLGAGVANNGFLQYEAGVYAGKQGNRAAHLAIGLAMNTPAFNSTTTPFGNGFEIKLTWSK